MQELSQNGLDAVKSENSGARRSDQPPGRVDEQAVNAAIHKIALTRMILAHRPETIHMAERLIVPHNGQVAQDLTKPGPEDKQAA